MVKCLHNEASNLEKGDPSFCGLPESHKGGLWETAPRKIIRISNLLPKFVVCNKERCQSSILHPLLLTFIGFKLAAWGNAMRWENDVQDGSDSTSCIWGD